MFGGRNPVPLLRPSPHQNHGPNSVPSSNPNPLSLTHPWLMLQYPNTLDAADGGGLGTWRGGGFMNEHIPFFTVGKEYRAPGFVATSVNKQTALDFINRAEEYESHILWCIKVRS